MNYVGNASGEFKVSLQSFQMHLNEVLGRLVEKFYRSNPAITKLLPEIQRLVRHLPVPEYSTFVLVDLDATQFRRGYETVLPLPNLDPWRTPCRYLYRLLGVQGHPDIETWMSHPTLF